MLYLSYITVMDKPKYYISKEHEFVIENYNSAPAFSSFFPGIAGTYGCPMWVFYANRGQCITSAGVYDKDSAIMEFQPANKAYRSVALQGFRTFLKINGKFYEPFGETSPHPKSMKISADKLVIAEENRKLKVRVEVTYFTIPRESFPALARMAKVSNLSRNNVEVELLDGLPTIVPFGFVNDLLKRISQTIEAWCVVERSANGSPFYKLKVAPADVSETHIINNGNFLISSAIIGGKPSPVSYIIDPSAVFGQVKSLEYPSLFSENKKFKLPPKQQEQGFLPSAFAYKKAVLKKGEALELFSLFGQADSLEILDKITSRVSSREYFQAKQAENKELIDGISSAAGTQSSSPSFDLYARQSFLDNVMRGGLPIKIGSKVVYVYYRKHGDMERDYNDFKLMPTYFSQGNGNYRDISQNRRNDILFNPEVAEHNVLRFFNLIQLDGFNPLVVLENKLYIEPIAAAEKVVNKHIHDPGQELAGRLAKPFLLGMLLKEIERAGLGYKTSREDFVQDVVNTAASEEGAIHGEGFWIDHFFYNTDLLESFGANYPEKVQALITNLKTFTFVDNDHILRERSEKYHLVGGKVRQFRSVKVDQEKTSLIVARGLHNHKVRTALGLGELYHTTLLVKLLCIAANKAASFDAEGIGLEMEADKPDWYDALNGLPALFGSSLSETLELKRMCAFTLKYLDGKLSIDIPVEIKEFVEQVDHALSAEQDPFQYWDKSYQIKEDYRRKTRLGISGSEVKISGEFAIACLKNVIKKCDTGIKRCLERYKTYCTYFINEVTDYEKNEHVIRVKKFTQGPLPLFLEGFVHALKVEKDKSIYPFVKASPLFDKKLKMYKVNAPLGEAPIEIGRTRIFTPGWLENESVWLHMEYKYMLELLKAGMYQEFFADFKKVLVPFLDPKRYKRSILENSSFLVSSAHPIKEKHGRGFVTRLSGGTAEMLDIWAVMTSGKKIFFLDEKGKLGFRLFPALPAWLFKNGVFRFKLLGTIDVTYINKSRKNTYDGLKPVSYKLSMDNKEVEINKPTLSEPFASLIRERKVRKIVVNLL